MTRPDAIVVGGGVIGCAVAFALAREGVAVTLYETGEIAGEASGAAAGMLAPVGEFQAPGPLLRLGLASLARFPALVAELRERTGIDPEHQVSGVLRVAAMLPELELAWLDAHALRALVPVVAPGLRGALFSPHEAHVRSPLLARAFAAAAERLGARVWTGAPVVGLLRERERVAGVETADGRHAAGSVVLCAGSFTRACAAWTDPPFAAPVVPVRGQIVTLDAPRPPLGRIVWGEDAYLVPKLDGSLVVGATVERVGFDRRVTAEGVRALLAAATVLVPGLAGATFRGAFAGLRPDTPDHLPLIGPVPALPGLVLATGHYRNGVLLAPVSAGLVADGLLGKGWPETALLPARFTAVG